MNGIPSWYSKRNPGLKLRIRFGKPKLLSHKNYIIDQDTLPLSHKFQGIEHIIIIYLFGGEIRQLGFHSTDSGRNFHPAHIDISAHRKHIHHISVLQLRQPKEVYKAH